MSRYKILQRLGAGTGGTVFCALPLSPAVLWYPTGRRVYPGDVLELEVLGALVIDDKLLRPYAPVSSELCPPAVLTASIGGWRYKLLAPQTVVTPHAAGELAFSFLAFDLVVDPCDVAGRTGGAARVVER